MTRSCAELMRFDNGHVSEMQKNPLRNCLDAKRAQLFCYVGNTSRGVVCSVKLLA